MKNVYFDNAATTKLDGDVLNDMMPYLTDNYGNASSIYKLGKTSRKAVEEAREKVANILNCKPNEIYFTAGGSESDNTAIKGIARANKNKGNHIITSKIEHPAVLDSCHDLEKEGFEVSYISVDENGTIDLEELKKEIKPTTILISVMTANNEIGTIQPIKEIGEIAHGSLRISIGKYNTKEEIDYLIDSLVEIVNKLRNMSPLWEEFMEGENK